MNLAIVPTRAERDRAGDRLRNAVGAGALTVDEFKEGLDTAAETHLTGDNGLAVVIQAGNDPGVAILSRQGFHSAEDYVEHLPSREAVADAELLSKGHTRSFRCHMTTGQLAPGTNLVGTKGVSQR